MTCAVAPAPPGGPATPRSARILELQAERSRIEAELLDVIGDWDADNDWALEGAITGAAWLARHATMSKAEARDKAEHYLQKVGVSHRKDAYPGHMSGGEQQRVAIARALAMEPEVMLFDEPTSALDPELVGDVLKVMQDLAQEGRTMVVVTHEMGFAREVSNQLVFLHKGIVEESGDPREVLVNPQCERLQQFLSGSLK